MMYLRYLCLAILNIAMFMLAYFSSPILPIFAIGKDHLPSYLSWFDTPDYTLDGDEGFKNEHAYFKGDVTGWKQYINRVLWLSRNPSYGFDHSVLGAVVLGVPEVVFGDPYVSDGPNLTIGRPTGKAGSVLLRSGPYFEYFLVRQWSDSPTCFRLRLGWKLSGFRLEPSVFKLGSVAQFVLSIKFAGKFSV